MNPSATGFAALQASCAQQGIPCTLGPPAAAVPDTLLGQPLDPALQALYRQHDGVSWSAPEFALDIYPLSGSDTLESSNASLRNSADDYVPPYPFADLLVFAQYGHQAAYLAAVPALAGAGGQQPVLYLDANEDPWAVPIASGVDAAFAVLSRYMERATEQGGRSGLGEVTFPLDVPELIAADRALVRQVQAQAFAPWIRGDESIQDWVQQTFARP